MSSKKTLNPLTVVFLLSFIFFAVFLFLSGIFALLKGSSGASSSVGILGSSEQIAKVELKGVIFDSKPAIELLKIAEENKKFRAIVLRLDSPGSGTAPAQEIYEAVSRIEKPVVVSMGNVAASGAYWIAMGADHVYANAGTLTGSIGVILPHANFEGLLKWAKIKRDPVKAGRLKDIGAPYREMTDQEKRILQGVVDDIHDQFKETVSKKRGLSMQKLEQLADGRIFSGRQAQKEGLVDEVGTFRDAVMKAAELAGIEGVPEVVEVKRSKRKFFEYFMENAMDEESDSKGFFGQASRFLIHEAVQAGLKEVSSQGSLESVAGSGQPAGFTGSYLIWDGASSSY